MGPNEVLQQFIEFCNTNSGFLRYHLAENSVLEWFGRTIRGGDNIYQYYRYDLCQQYDHNFEKAEECLPIEIKPIHNRTKEISKEILPITKTKTDEEFCMSDFETPPQEKLSPVLPKLKRSYMFLSTDEDLGVTDLNGTDLSGIQEAITPPPIISGTSSSTTNNDEPKLKKFKYSEQTISSDNDFMKYFDNKNPIDLDVSMDINDDNNCNVNKESESKTETIYSELMYLESVGILKMKLKSKHRGIIGLSQSSTCTNSSRSDYETASCDLDSNSWDRSTRIKISYRLNKNDNQIKFYLIIYEHLARSTAIRRNLLNEFHKTDSKKKKHSLKRALRL